MTIAALTKPQVAAFKRYMEAGAVFVNQKRDGFDGFHAKDAIALMIARVVVIEDDELRLTGCGAMLAEARDSADGKSFRLSPAASAAFRPVGQKIKPAG